MQKKYLQLNDINAYKTAFNLSNFVGDVTIKWENFAKITVGEQFVTAMDSVSANIAEGFGRDSKKDKIKFYRYRSGSVKECFDWNQKSKEQKLLSADEYNHIFSQLQKFPKEINQLFQYTNSKLAILPFNNSAIQLYNNL
ncbi:MAG: four helix bundle protein [Bacteroidetes bacterium]|nr:four helix bundle protein [Bacteroidota bacterium]